MDNKSGGLVSGLGGAAMLALLLMPTGIYPSKSPGGGAPPVTQPAGPPGSGALSGASTHTESGPWRAICKEFETDFEQHGERHRELKRGVADHAEPEGADVTAKSYVVHKKIDNLPVEETYEVSSHPVGSPADCVPSETKVDVLLATIADPLESHFALYFDRDIEALEEAAKEAGGYSISGYWLPWDVGGAVELKADPKSAAEWLNRSKQPGVLVFHKGNGDRLFVFLAGETPTSGLQRVQFENALLYIHDLSVVEFDRPLACIQPPVVAIAAPHFSASLLGMTEALRQARSKFLSQAEVRILSPNASSDMLIGDFKNSLGSKSRFGTLALLYSRQEKAALNYLYDLGYVRPAKDIPGDIAILQEDESAFSVNSTISEDVANHPLTLYYPRDLSPLRKLTDALIPSDTEINGVKLPLWSIPVTLGESMHVTQDSPPAFAPEQEAARIDHALRAIVARLKEHKIRAVIVDASNNLDALLLLEYFRRELPNMRFVHFGAEEFEVGRPENVELTGTISVSAAPLFIDPFFHGNAVHFGSQDTEGTFMAAALLLNDKNLDPTDKSKIATSAITTLVGRSNFMLASSDGNPSFPIRADLLKVTQADEPGMPRSWRILLLAALTALIVHFVSLWRSKVLSGSQERTHLSWAYPGYCNKYESNRISSLVALNNQYLLLEFAVCATSVSAFWNRLSAVGTGDGILLALNTGALICCLLCTAWMIRRCCVEPELKAALAKLVISLVYLVWTIVMWSRVLWRFVGPGVTFNAMRIMLTSEGLSPLIPFMALTVAYIVFCRTELNGIDWASRRAVVFTFKKEFDITLYETNRRLTEWLNPSKLPSFRIWVFGLIGAIIFGIGLKLSSALSGFDGNWFRWWIIYPGFGLLLATLMLTVYRAWKIWKPLRNMLQWLEETEMVSAFTSIHEEDLPKLRIWDLGKREQELTIMAKTVKRLESLLPETHVVAQKALDVVREAEVEQEKHTCSESEELAKQLNAAMDAALPYLHRDPVRIEVREYQRYLALRFLLLFRYSLLNIRNLFTFVVYGFALLAVTVMTYPFEGRSNLTVALTMVFVFILSSAGMMFVQIEKSSILSAIEGTTAGKVSYFELFKHLISIGGVPALIVIMTQFPSLAQVVFSWAKPGLDLLK